MLDAKEKRSFFKPLSNHTSLHVIAPNLYPPSLQQMPTSSQSSKPCHHLPPSCLYTIVFSISTLAAAATNESALQDAEKACTACGWPEGESEISCAYTGCGDTKSNMQIHCGQYLQHLQILLRPPCIYQHYKPLCSFHLPKPLLTQCAPLPTHNLSYFSHTTSRAEALLFWGCIAPMLCMACSYDMLHAVYIWWLREARAAWLARQWCANKESMQCQYDRQKNLSMKYLCHFYMLNE